MFASSGPFFFKLFCLFLVRLSSKNCKLGSIRTEIDQVRSRVANWSFCQNAADTVGGPSSMRVWRQNDTCIPSLYEMFIPSSERLPVIRRREKEEEQRKKDTTLMDF